MYSHLPNERYLAASLGETKYFTGKACKRGHISPRNTRNGSCCKCCSERASAAWEAGKRPNKESRARVNKKWNASGKGYEAKQKWKEKDPKRAWAVSATGAAKGRSRLKELPFDLTSDYVESITPDVCPVFGTAFKFIGAKKITAESPSLDRKKPELGYVVGNVIVISHKANMIKNAYGYEDVQKVADWLRVLESTL